MTADGKYSIDSTHNEPYCYIYLFLVLGADEDLAYTSGLIIIS
jgi:hypothetical protein